MSEMVERVAKAIPMVHWYKGRRLEDMSKEQLIEAVIELGKWNQTLIDGGRADREMFGRIVKSMRPS